MTWAAYLRVSTDKQTVENQEPDVRAVVEAREKLADGLDWTAGMFRESASAVKDRPVFSSVMDLARRGKLRRLYVWSLDRFGRSMFRNLADLRELAALGVEVVSVKESWVEKTADPMLRQLLLAIFSWVAEHEHARLKERTRAGLDRARAQGKALGRKRVDIPPAAVAKAIELRANVSRGWREVAAELGRLGFGRWSHATLARVCTKTVPETRRGRPGWPRGSR